MTVTIDQIGLSSHKRYAQDQQMLDPKLIQDSSLVSPLSEINGTSAIYASQWEHLFDLQIRNLPWATFSPPPKYRNQGRRFFSHRILPTIYIHPVKDKEEEKDDSQDNKNDMETVLLKVKEQGTLSENGLKESHALVNLFELVGNLNEMLDHIQSHRLQYQKG